MFSNGTEHMAFMESYCYRCAKFRDWQEEPEHVCPIEAAISLAAIEGEKAWPTEHLLPTRRMSAYQCMEFERGEPGTSPLPEDVPEGQISIEEAAMPASPAIDSAGLTADQLADSMCAIPCDEPADRPLRRGDEVHTRNAVENGHREEAGLVLRVAWDGRWADVQWGGWRKRMLQSSLVRVPR